MNRQDFESSLMSQSHSYSPIRHLSEQVSWKPHQPNNTPVIPNKRNKLYTFNNFNSLSITDKQEAHSPTSSIQSASNCESQFSLSMSKYKSSLQRKHINGTPLKLKQISPIAKRIPIQIYNKQNFMSFGNHTHQCSQNYGADKECVVVSQQQLLQFTHKFAEEKVKSQEQISYLKIVISDLQQQINMLKLENADLYECLQYKSSRQQQLSSYLKYAEQYCPVNYLDKPLPQTQKTTTHSRQHSHRYNCTKSEKSSYPSIIEQFQFINNENIFANRTSTLDCELQEENRNLRARVEFLQITLEHLEIQKQLSEEMLRDYQYRQSKLSDNYVSNTQIQQHNAQLQLLIKQKNIEIEIYQKALEDCAKFIAQSKQQQKFLLTTFTEKDLKNVVFRMMVPILEMEEYK